MERYDSKALLHGDTHDYPKKKIVAEEKEYRLSGSNHSKSELSHPPVPFVERLSNGGSEVKLSSRSMSPASFSTARLSGGVSNPSPTSKTGGLTPPLYPHSDTPSPSHHSSTVSGSSKSKIMESSSSKSRLLLSSSSKSKIFESKYTDNNDYKDVDISLAEMKIDEDVDEDVEAEFEAYKAKPNVGTVSVSIDPIAQKIAAGKQFNYYCYCMAGFIHAF